MTGSANISGTLTSDFITLNSEDSSKWTNNSVVPKSYVDSISSGIVLKQSCKCATTTDDFFSTYNGKDQFTDVSLTLQIDNYTVQNGNRVLVKNQVNPIENGIYVYDNISDISVGKLTRSDDLAYGSSAKGAATFVQNGDTNKKINFLQSFVSSTTNNAITGTDNLDFTAQNSVDFSLDSSTLDLYNGNTLRVKPDLTLESLTTTDNISVGNELSVTGDTSLGNKLTITNGGLSVSGDTSLGNKLTITNGGLEVNGDTYLNNDIYMTNAKIIKAKNIYGEYENFLWPRNSGNDGTYLQFGSGGFYIRNNSETNAIFIDNILNTTFYGTVNGISKSMVGLGNVDNTSDANKPVSTATTTELGKKANLDSPKFTGTVSGINSTMVGLGNVDNTKDIDKKVSTATQTALDLKANLASPTFTGTVTASTFSGNATSATNATYINGTTLYTIPYQSASNKTSFLDVGTTGYVLISGGSTTKPTWTTNPTFGTCKATTFEASSDYRIKENVLNLINDSSFTVDNLRPVTYKNILSGKQDIGLIAHELQEQYPFLVSGEKDGA